MASAVAWGALASAQPATAIHTFHTAPSTEGRDGSQSISDVRRWGRERHSREAAVSATRNRSLRGHGRQK